MKHILPILVMLAMLVALPASPAWSQNNDYEQCMNDCLKSAKKYGDEDFIKEATRGCAYLCNSKILGDSNLGSADIFIPYESMTKCLRICGSLERRCLRLNEQPPEKCQNEAEECRSKCLQ